MVPGAPGTDQKSDAPPYSGAFNGFWAVGESDLLRQLDASRQGLCATEARRRLALHGRNAVETPSYAAIPARILRKLAEPLVAILLVAAAVAGATGEVASFVIIVTVVVLSIALDVVQEHRAEIAADALRRSVAIRADVHRDGA